MPRWEITGELLGHRDHPNAIGVRFYDFGHINRQFMMNRMFAARNVEMDCRVYRHLKSAGIHPQVSAIIGGALLHANQGFSRAEPAAMFCTNSGAIIDSWTKISDIRRSARGIPVKNSGSPWDTGGSYRSGDFVQPVLTAIQPRGQFASPRLLETLYGNPNFRYGDRIPLSKVVEVAKKVQRGL